MLQTCNAGRTGWVNVQQCASQALCDAPGAACKSACTNLARAPLATPYSSGGGTTANLYGPEGMNDGILGCAPTANGGGWHWISNGIAPGGTAYVQLNWGIAQTISMIHIDTANGATGCYYNGVQNISAGRTFEGATVQYWTSAGWTTAGTISGQNNDFSWNLPSPVTTIAIRLNDVYSGTVGNTPVLEWFVYAITGCSSPIDQ
jgi:hypothetical protein